MEDLTAFDGQTLLLLIICATLGAVMIIREVFSFLKSKSDKDILDGVQTSISEMSNTVNKMSIKVYDLWAWHNKSDSDGIPIWYVKRAMEEKIYIVHDDIKQQNQKIDTVIQKLDDLLDS